MSLALSMRKYARRAGKWRRMDGVSSCEIGGNVARFSDAFGRRVEGSLAAGRGGTLSPSASLSPDDARRPIESRAVAGMGSESLLLPEHYSDKRFDHPFTKQ